MNDFSQQCEALAAQYLGVFHGWSLVESNVHCRWGELDLVMDDFEGVRHVVEVKARRSRAYGHVVESLTREKLRRLKRTLQWYRLERGWRGPLELHFLGMEFNPLVIHSHHL